MSEVAEAVVARAYRVEERLAIDVEITDPDGTRVTSWALNEASMEKGPDTRMVEFLVSIDGHPPRAGALTVWCSRPPPAAPPTPGQPAGRWWPDVAALLVVPLSAHALFVRPLVLSPDCEIEVALSPQRPQSAVVWCDGRRRLDLQAGQVMRVRRSASPVPLARLHSPAFVARLVNKFALPVQGWRRSGSSHDHRPGDQRPRRHRPGRRRGRTGLHQS